MAINMAILGVIVLLFAVEFRINEMTKTVRRMEERGRWGNAGHSSGR